MAGLRGAAITGEIATGTAVKTLMQLVAAADHRVLVHELAVSFQGISNTDAPILIEILRQTTAGTMSALSLVKWGDDDGDESLQTTAQHTATAEPTAGDVLMSDLIHPQGGFNWQAPFGGAFVIQGGDRLGLRVTAGVDVDAVARMLFEE